MTLTTLGNKLTEQATEKASQSPDSIEDRHWWERSEHDAGTEYTVWLHAGYNVRATDY